MAAGLSGNDGVKVRHFNTGRNEGKALPEPKKILVIGELDNYFMPTTNFIVTMGDSVTAGVRDGVTASQTYSVLLENKLHEAGWQGRITARGVGGEDTNGALLRLPQVIDLRPQVVTLMYGINDSCIPVGDTEPPVDLAKYRVNLESLVETLREAGIEPVLITSNPMANFGITKTLYGDREPYRTKGINFLLNDYAATVREVGRELKVPVVDVYTAFAARAEAGENREDYLTDGMHPNPAGHQIIGAQLARHFQSAHATPIK